jgi:putative hydroxymethylpyrimidine transport system ATP-binding protein
MSRHSVSLRNLSFVYGTQLIFQQVNLELAPGKWIGLLGASGSGKSTLLHLIAGLLPLAADARVTAQDGSPVQDHIAYMAQADLLLPWMSVLDNALLSVKLRPALSANHYSVKKAQAIDLLNTVGLGQALASYPPTLSGGMRQRVALVRTLLMDKPIILMDEPFSALDAITRHRLQALAADLLRDKAVVFVTHDPQEALRLAHEIYLLQGQPATLTRIANLDTFIPRDSSTAEQLTLQASLWDTLLKNGDIN